MTAPDHVTIVQTGLDHVADNVFRVKARESFRAIVAERDEAWNEVLFLRDEGESDVRMSYRRQLQAMEAERDEARRELEHWKGCNLYPLSYREAVESLRVSEAERDEARRDWQQYVHEVKDEQRRADAAEAEVARLNLVLDEIAREGCYADAMRAIGGRIDAPTKEDG